MSEKLTIQLFQSLNHLILGFQNQKYVDFDDDGNELYRDEVRTLSIIFSILRQRCRKYRYKTNITNYKCYLINNNIEALGLNLKPSKDILVANEC